MALKQALPTASAGPDQQTPSDPFANKLVVASSLSATETTLSTVTIPGGSSVSVDSTPITIATEPRVVGVAFSPDNVNLVFSTSVESWQARLISTAGAISLEIVAGSHTTTAGAPINIPLALGVLG